MSFNESSTSVRQRATLDSIFAQVADLVDQASGLASDAERIADDLCGATPDASTSDGREAGFAGKLDALSRLLDMVAHHQHRARSAGRRIASVVLTDNDKMGLSAGANSTGSVDAKGRY